MDMRILMTSDKDEILALAKSRLIERTNDPREAELLSWSARWREEALDHYLKLGWSIGAFAGGHCAGFALAQPLLFTRSHTQTLWIEHIEAPNREMHQQLLDGLTRWAKDKHFQCVWAETDQALELGQTVKDSREILTTRTMA